jgi:hypothetical protein
MDQRQSQTTALSIGQKTKLSLVDLAELLERAAEEIEESDEISPDLFQDFKALSYSVSEKTDDWINYLSFVDSQYDRLKAQVERLRKKMWAYDTHRTSLKQYLVNVIRAHPALPFKGETGRLTVRRNSAKSVDYSVSFHPRAFERIVHIPEQIPPEYLTTHTITVINHEAVKAALEKGEALSWATLVQGEHLRIL